MLYHPKWSKAKKRLESFICESLRSRVDFHMINYRKAHDQLGRAVITVDKIEKLSMCTMTVMNVEYYKELQIRYRDNNFKFDDVTHNLNVQNEAYQQLSKVGIYGQYDFFIALEQNFNSSIEAALKSSNPLIKILCMLDRRVGKRTLHKLKHAILAEPELAQDFYKLRCEVENILH